MTASVISVRTGVRAARNCSRAASAVWRSSSAVVTEPTPPGTGVSAAATVRTLASSTSPASEPSESTLVPTSMTTECSETSVPVSNPVRPAATTTTSASLVYFPSGPDFEWQTVVVASFCSSSRDSGLPTTVERPTTTTLRPATGISKWSSISTTARAVAGANARSPTARSPRLTGLAPSMSFSGAMYLTSSWVLTPGGRGVCRMMPLTEGSALRSFSTAMSTCSVASWPTSMILQPMPAFSAARSMERTYQCVELSSVATTTARVGREPSSASAAAWAVACCWISLARGLPESTDAVIGGSFPVPGVRASQPPERLFLQGHLFVPPLRRAPGRP